MHNCYSELTNLENPFTAEDLFVDEDWDLFENYQIGKMNFIKWKTRCARIRQLKER